MHSGGSEVKRERGFMLVCWAYRDPCSFDSPCRLPHGAVRIPYDISGKSMGTLGGIGKGWFMERSRYLGLAQQCIRFYSKVTCISPDSTVLC